MPRRNQDVPQNGLLVSEKLCCHEMSAYLTLAQGGEEILEAAQSRLDVDEAVTNTGDRNTIQVAVGEDGRVKRDRKGSGQYTRSQSCGH